MAKKYDFGHLHYRKKTANNACNPKEVSAFAEGRGVALFDEGQKEVYPN